MTCDTHIPFAVTDDYEILLARFATDAKIRAETAQ
jgi:hypothetical protein